MANQTVFLHFDGGTPCNIPSMGYGIGYGSYSFNGGSVSNVNHGVPCSNNGAEILTLAVALEDLMTKCDPHETEVIIMGDSQTTLGWVKKVFEKGDSIKVNQNVSQSMKDGIVRLIQAVKPFASIQTKWLPREHAVKAFGH